MEQGFDQMLIIIKPALLGLLIIILLRIWFCSGI